LAFTSSNAILAADPPPPLEGGVVEPTPTVPPVDVPPVVGPAPTTPSDGNLLTNGSFEATPLASGRWSALDAIPGWRAVSGGMIELWNNLNGVKAADGQNFGELDYLGARDGLYQEVATRAGQHYALSFDARRRPGTSAATNAIEVLWNDKVVATVPPGGNWDTHTLSVTGTGGMDRLTLREVGSQSADGLGALYDNVSLVAKGSTGGNAAVADASPITSIGAGPDALILGISQDAFRGDARFTVSVDGRQVGGVQTAQASHAEGESDRLLVLGDWSEGKHTVAVNFLNDLWDGTSGGDRNLYVDGASLNGSEIQGAERDLRGPGAQSFTFQG
uniref:carbohydrate-binding domain-containing protein n=1 Tax=uncultured Methylobacterium sp. TaxID=157278 RepID=UPI0026357F73